MSPLQRRSIDFHCEQHEKFQNPQPAPANQGPVPPPPLPPGGRGPAIPVGTIGVPPINGGPVPQANPLMETPSSTPPLITGPNLATG